MSIISTAKNSGDVVTKSAIAINIGRNKENVT